MLILIHGLINHNVLIQDPFYDLARGLSLTRKKDALQWYGAAMTQPPTSPLCPPLCYVTSEKGMSYGFMNKNPSGVKFAEPRKVFCRQMFGALLMTEYT